LHFFHWRRRIADGDVALVLVCESRQALREINEFYWLSIFDLNRDSYVIWHLFITDLIFAAYHKMLYSGMPTATEQKPSDKFKKAMKQILSVPKKELDRRELQYK